MTGPREITAKLRPGRRARHATPTVMEVMIVVLLALNLKIVWDAHKLTDSDLALTERIENIVRKTAEEEVATCYQNVPRGAEARRLIRYADSFSDNPAAVQAFRDYLFKTEGAMPTWGECAGLAIKLGVR